MIKIFLFLIIGIIVYSNDAQKKVIIFDMLMKNITHKSAPLVYIHDPMKQMFLSQNSLNIVEKCNESDIVILTTLNYIPIECENKIMFGTKYSHLKDNRVIGSFFWQKGRPNILFYKQRLDAKGIVLSKSFDKYIEKR